MMNWTITLVFCPLFLLGGLWIIQALLAVLLLRYARFDGRASLAGWFSGICCASVMGAHMGFTTTIYPFALGVFSLPCYIVLPSLAANITVATLLTISLKGFRQSNETERARMGTTFKKACAARLKLLSR